MVHIKLSNENFKMICFSFSILGAEVNFEKYDDDQITGFGEHYDYGSIMHYNKAAYSKNGKDTIVPKVRTPTCLDYNHTSHRCPLLLKFIHLYLQDPNAEIGQRVSLSTIDLNKLKKMFNC